MQKSTLLVCLLLCSAGYAQNNIITVPVAEPVAEKKLYLQPGVVANASSVQFANILTYGLGWDFQAGVTITDLTLKYGPGDTLLPIYSVDPGSNPDVLINLQKGFKLGSNAWVAVGTLSGVNLSASAVGFSTFNYVNAQTKVLGENLLLLGVYQGNGWRLATKGSRFGLLAGFKIPVTQHLTVAADFISGNHARSFINAGLGLKLTDEWSTYAGAVIPAPESGNKFGGTLQFRYLTK